MNGSETQTQETQATHEPRFEPSAETLAEMKAEGALGESFELFYYEKSRQKKIRSLRNYESALTKIGRFDSLASFWSVYAFVTRPDDLLDPCDFQLFKEGISPTWEDPANANGGKLVLRLRKGLASRYWEELMMAFIGKQFRDHVLITGIVVAVRVAEDNMSLWIAETELEGLVDRVRQDLFRILQLPQDTIVEFVKHTALMRKRGPRPGRRRHYHNNRGGRSGRGRRGGYDRDRGDRPRRGGGGGWRGRRR